MSFSNTLNNKTNNIENDLHPCQYCTNICRGLQCRNCHLKMISEKQGECIDCKNQFYALRSDGTKRKRCLDCQNNYNIKYIAKCPMCREDYHAFLEDGRVFDKCFKCYQNSFGTCEMCSEKSSNGQPYCKKCYMKQKEHNIKLLSIDNMDE
jgi:hypothetical protein